MSELMQRLSVVQTKLKAPKNQRNTFGNYNYRSCEDILEAAKPLLHENGLTLVLSDEIKTVGDRIYVEASATVHDLVSGDHLTVTASAREEETKKGMDAAQITGSASSYARKYALNGLFCIDDSKIEATPDPDTQPRTEEPKPRRVEYTCKDCGEPIRDTEIGGKMYAAKTIAERAKKNYKVYLCADCAKARKNTVDAAKVIVDGD